MKRNKYSAGAVKLSLWFLEFRKVVQLLATGKTFEDIKKQNEDENLFGASTPARAKLIYLTVRARINEMDESFYPLFLESDVATQKYFALAATLAHDTLFFDFMYEVVREKLIIGNDVLTDSDLRIFFRNKAEQHAEIEKLTDKTLIRLARSYKAMLFEAGVLDEYSKSLERKIYKPVIDPVLKHWLEDYGYSPIAKALEGLR